MTREQKCWKLIEDAKWKFDHDYERISFRWSELSKNTFDMLNEFISEKAATLMDQYEDVWLGKGDYEGLNIGDDGWCDLIYDVVGRGERFYNSITAEKLKEMVENDDYEESFAYCLQIERDE